MTLMEWFNKLNVTALSSREVPVTNRKLDNHSCKGLSVWCLTDIFYQDSFPTRPIFLTWFSLSLSISIFIWQCAKAVTESKDSFSFCIYTENLWFLVMLFLVWLVRQPQFSLEKLFTGCTDWGKPVPSFDWLPLWALPGQASACSDFDLLSQGPWKTLAA